MQMEDESDWGVGQVDEEENEYVIGIKEHQK